MTAIASKPIRVRQTASARNDNSAARVVKNPALRGPVVLATKGSVDSSSAFAVAQLIARRTNRKLEIISVVEPVIYYNLPPEVQPASFALDAQSTAEREVDIKGPFAQRIVPGVNWSADVILGQTATEVCDAARSLDATFIVVGASPHRRLRRVVAGHKAAQILHRSASPVLSVAPWLKALPKNVVAAIDFHPASVRAAEAALLLMDEGSRLTLVHVIPPNYIFPAAVVTDPILRESIQTEMEKVARALRAQAGDRVVIDTVVLDGDAASEVLTLAEKLDADLIAVGTQAGSAFRRFLVGSVATEVFHAALCSVLASPPPPFADRLHMDLEMRGTVATADQKEFGALLDAFSTRNKGKLVSLEEDDDLFGAQIQVHGYRLRAVTFDKSDKRAEIILSAPDSATVHLTRTIPGVTSVAVADVKGAANMALQIKHGKSQTLVLIDPVKKG